METIYSFKGWVKAIIDNETQKFCVSWKKMESVI